MAVARFPIPRFALPQPTVTGLSDRYHHHTSQTALARLLPGRHRRKHGELLCVGFGRSRCQALFLFVNSEPILPWRLQQADMEIRSTPSLRIYPIALCWMLVLLLLLYVPANRSGTRDIHALTKYTPIRPVLRPSEKNLPDPVRWLEENSGNRYAIERGYLPQFSIFDRKPKAALISLVRNSELEGMIHSMQQLEYRWNRKYQVRDEEE